MHPRNKTKTTYLFKWLHAPTTRHKGTYVIERLKTAQKRGEKPPKKVATDQHEKKGPGEKKRRRQIRMGDSMSKTEKILNNASGGTDKRRGKSAQGSEADTDEVKHNWGVQGYSTTGDSMLHQVEEKKERKEMQHSIGVGGTPGNEGGCVSPKKKIAGGSIREEEKRTV